MSDKIKKFIKELKESTGESFLFREETWEYSHTLTTKITYSILSPMSGFECIEKESREELEESFGLIRHLVDQLKETKETKRKIDVKLIK